MRGFIQWVGLTHRGAFRSVPTYSQAGNGGEVYHSNWVTAEATSGSERKGEAGGFPLREGGGKGGG